MLYLQRLALQFQPLGFGVGEAGGGGFQLCCQFGETGGVARFKGDATL